MPRCKGATKGGKAWKSELTLKSSKKLLKAICFLTQRSDELIASVQDVRAAIDAEKAQVQARLNELAASMQSLKDQVAAGAAATPEQLDELKLAVENIFTPAPVVDAPVETPILAMAHRPKHHDVPVQIHYHAQIQPAFLSAHIGYVRDRPGVGLTGCKVALQVIVHILWLATQRPSCASAYPVECFVKPG